MDLVRDSRHIAKHLPGTPQMLREIRRHGDAHVFVTQEMMEYVTQEILRRGEFTGKVRGFERYGLQFEQVIGYRVDSEGGQLPLHYGEMKVRRGKYHVVPRFRPSQ